MTNLLYSNEKDKKSNFTNTVIISIVVTVFIIIFTYILWYYTERKYIRKKNFMFDFLAYFSGETLADLIFK